MKKVILTTLAAALALPAMSAAQYSYVGSIETHNNPLPLATDGTKLFYATFDNTNSSIYVIDDPTLGSIIDQTGPFPSTPIDTVVFAATRGFMGLQYDTATASLYASGDNGSSTATVLRKYDGGSYTPDATFNSATSGLTLRVEGIALVDNLIAAPLFSSIEWFDKSTGSQAGLSNAPSSGTVYQREAIYNSDDDVIYTTRNGNTNGEMLVGYWDGFTTSTGGGAWNAGTLINDGAINSTFGIATQHGFYDASANQLITLDTAANTSGNVQIRIWDVSNNGATLTLDQAISPTDTTPNFTGINDAVVIGDRLYVSSTSDDVIYIFETAAASVNEWQYYK